MTKLKYKKFEGLHIVCKKCARNIELTNTAYNGCTHPIERQKYKGMFRINGRRLTKDLVSREYDAAVQELLIWKEELKNPLKLKQIEKKKEVKFDLLEDCILMFSDWLENVGVPYQEQKKRSQSYIKQTIMYLMRFNDFVKTNGYNSNTLTIYKIDKHIFGEYYEYMEKTTQSPSTFNGNLRALKSFFKFLEIEKKYAIENPAIKAKLKCETPDPKSIADEDFLKLLSVISENDSVEVGNNGKQRNRYREWTRASFELAAFTGMRLEEVATLKYSDIKLDNNNELEYLEGIDLKYMRAHNSDGTKAKKVVPIPITPELEDLLIRLKYRDHIGADRYLIDGDCVMKRESLVKEMSHAFTFFRRKAGLSEDFSIKHLRKTFLSKLQSQTGLAESAGYQKTVSVLQKNYYDKRMMSKTIKDSGFSYFGKNEKVSK